MTPGKQKNCQHSSVADLGRVHAPPLYLQNTFSLYTDWLKALYFRRSHGQLHPLPPPPPPPPFPKFLDPSLFLKKLPMFVKSRLGWRDWVMGYWTLRSSVAGQVNSRCWSIWLSSPQYWHPEGASVAEWAKVLLSWQLRSSGFTPLRPGFGTWTGHGHWIIDFSNVTHLALVINTCTHTYSLNQERRP